MSAVALDTQCLAENAFCKVDDDCVYKVDCDQHASIRLQDMYRSSWPVLERIGRKDGYVFGDYRLQVDDAPHDVTSVAWSVNGKEIVVYDANVPEDQRPNVWSRSANAVYMLPIDPFVSRVWNRPILTSVSLHVRTASALRAAIYFRPFQLRVGQFVQFLARHDMDFDGGAQSAEDVEHRLFNIPLLFTTRGLGPVVHFTAFDGMLEPVVPQRFHLALYNHPRHGPVDPSRLVCSFLGGPHRAAILRALASCAALDKGYFYCGRFASPYSSQLVIRVETRDQVQNCIDAMGGEVLDFFEIHFEQPTAEQVSAARLSYDKEVRVQQALYDFLQTGDIAR